MSTNVMIGVAIFIGLIAVWLIWSRFQVNKSIKEAFESVSEDNPLRAIVALREVIRYCTRNKIVYKYVPTPGFMVVEYGNKSVVVQQEGGFRMGNSFFSTGEL